MFGPSRDTSVAGQIQIVAVMVSVAGCARTEDVAPARTRVTWMMGMDVINKPMIDDLERMFEAEHSGIDLVMMWVPGGQQYHTKLKTLTAAGDPPDLFWCSDVHATYMLTSLADITPFVERDAREMDLDDFYPELLDACRRNGRYYYLPRYFNLSLLYYNKDLFDEAGVAYPREDWTWDDYIAAAKKLTKAGPDGKIVQWGTTVAHGWWGEWHVLVQEAGGAFFSPDLRTCALNSPEALRAFRFFYDKVHTYKVSPRPGFGPTAPGLASREVAMDFGGHTGLWPMYRKIEGLHWDIQLIPRGPKTRVGGEVAVDCIGIAKDSRNIEASWQALKFLVSRESIRRHVEQGYLPVRESVACETVLAGEAGRRPQDPQHTEVVYEALRYSKPIPRQPDYIEIALEIVQPEVDLMLMGELTPEEAVNRVAAAVDTFIETLGTMR